MNMKPLAIALDTKVAYLAFHDIHPPLLTPAKQELGSYQRELSAAYEGRDDTDTDVARGCYAALAWECWQQFVALTKVVKVSFHDTDPTPLGTHGGPSYAKIKREVQETNQLRIFRSSGDHDILDRMIYTHNGRAETGNSIFRAVHDFFGHLATGGYFNWAGETAAYYSHAAMFSANARKALFSETVMQQCFFAVHHDYAPQKCVIIRSPGELQPPYN